MHTFLVSFLFSVGSVLVGITLPRVPILKSVTISTRSIVPPPHSPANAPISIVLPIPRHARGHPPQSLFTRKLHSQSRSQNGNHNANCCRRCRPVIRVCARCFCKSTHKENRSNNTMNLLVHYFVLFFFIIIIIALPLPQTCTHGRTHTDTPFIPIFFPCCDVISVSPRDVHRFIWCKNLTAGKHTYYTVE